MIKKKDMELVKEALYQYEMLRLKHIESLPQVEFSPTEEFNEKISELLSKPASATIKKSLTKRQKIAILITATVILALAVTACAFGNKIKGFFIDIFNSYASAASDNLEEYTFIQYELQWLPNSYRMKDSIISKNGLKTTYSKDNENIILIQIISSNASIFIDKENTDYEIKIIKDTEVYHRNTENCYYLFWIKDDYSFNLECPNTIEWSDIEKMISSIAIAENQAE